MANYTVANQGELQSAITSILASSDKSNTITFADSISWACHGVEINKNINFEIGSNSFDIMNYDQASWGIHITERANVTFSGTGSGEISTNDVPISGTLGTFHMTFNNLTIKCNGQGISAAYGRLSVLNCTVNGGLSITGSGKLVVNNSTINGSEGSMCIYCIDDAEASIIGSTIVSTGDSEALHIENGNCTIDDSTIHGKGIWPSVGVGGSGQVLFNSGSIICEEQSGVCIYNPTSSFIMNGGTVTSNQHGISELQRGSAISYAGSSGSPTIEINGGTLNGDIIIKHQYEDSSGIAVNECTFNGELDPRFVPSTSEIQGNKVVRKSVPPGPGPEPTPISFNATTVDSIQVFISPNIKSYSNLYGGVLYVSDLTFVSFGVELVFVKYKLPGQGIWITGYVRSDKV